VIDTRGVIEKARNDEQSRVREILAIGEQFGEQDLAHNTCKRARAPTQ
jgi:hypothetical protein